MKSKSQTRVADDLSESVEITIDSDPSLDLNRTSNKRTSHKSRVNFLRLSDAEKIQRLQNMALKIKKLKTQVMQLKRSRIQQTHT
jgi:hypothetical protein